MKPAEVLSLVRPRPPQLPTTATALAHCITIEDVRALAARRWPREVRDYVEGGAEGEATLGRNTAAYGEYDLVPKTLRDVTHVDTSATLLGCAAALPVALAPTGYTRMMHGDGESAVARAAADAGLPYTLSTMATTRIEDVAAASPGDLWFQLYVWKDRGLVRELVRRAEESGYRSLMVTVDTPVSGLRARDTRNGFTVPPQLTFRSLAGMARHPAWCARLLGGPPITFANIDGARGETPSSVMELGLKQFDSSVTWDDLATIRQWWPGTLTVKGVLSEADVRRAVDVGADGAVLSNHGGRQLDRAVAPIDVLQPVREAVGDRVEVYVDSGIRHGSDAALAIALGADGVLLGRPYLYGLGAGGQAGVTRVLEILGDELRRTMQLLGVTSVPQLRREGRSVVRRRDS
ncbi:MAG: alpha-hydroxy-acid oxidizing protein [Intrasporangium sp.]|uniref:alpha-hydroxy acid oxidase n=1 Tax=Intrasporangium sp. TaxID=1925024 RepID=UPI002648C649|nr:alpha-hydroxy acid oxidase [Intrasporangium sp.]MDN5797581.1 alpha-hydroxy-acid oxidizing protein [Intrasporangium sp.]